MQIRNIFSIPLGITVNEQHKKIQKNLVKYCTKLKNKKKKGGWLWESHLYNTYGHHLIHSDDKFKDVNNFVFSNVLEFSKTIGYEKLGVQCKESWFNVYNKYDYQEAHDHMGFNISAIYILQGSHKTGTINFKNHSPSKEVHLFNPENEYTFSNMCINPQPGLLLIFDSNLVHSVSQNLTNEKRISLAYNFNVYK